MTREEKNLNQQISRKCRWCLGGSIGLVIILGITRMILSNRPATWGDNLNQLKQSVAEIKKENLYLETELAAKSGNLHELQIEAMAAGYTDTPKVKYFHEHSLAFN